MLSCASGKHIKTAVMTARKSGGRAGGGFEFLFVKMTEVLVSSFETQGSNDVPQDSVSLNFAKIEVDYKEQKATGSLGAATSFLWNLSENKQA